jgi:hypothetical protein
MALQTFGPTASGRAPRTMGRTTSGFAAEDMEAVVMKRVVLVLGVAAVCGALLAGRDDIRRFREMRKL